jgi:hypothetical protein
VTESASPADLLRQAATLMRERAQATARPHHPYSDPRMKLVETTEDWSAEVENYLGGEMGEHCASWHPSVALAVANLLDFSAATSRILDAVGQDPDNRPTHHYALAVARAYLGIEVPA